MTPKPCPFCGARGRYLVARETGGNYESPTWVVECDNCSTTGPQIQPGVDTDGNYTKAEAICAWNTRSGK